MNIKLKYASKGSLKRLLPMYEFGRFSRLDPLHLPRAPILRHNVSLCHGRATPLFSPSATPAASPVARSRVYGILDFGNSVARMVQLNAGRVGPPKIGEETRRGGWRETVFQHACPSSHPPWPPFRRCLFSAFSESTSESMMQPRMSRENIIAFVLASATLYPNFRVRWSTGKYNNHPSDNVLWMTSTNP